MSTMQFAAGLAAFFVLLVSARVVHLDHEAHAAEVRAECAQHVPVSEITATAERASDALIRTIMEPVVTTEGGREKMAAVAAIATRAAGEFDRLEAEHCGEGGH